jgi:thymidylate synthase
MTNLTTGAVAELFTKAVLLARNGERASPRGMPTREVLDVRRRFLLRIT